MSAERFVRLNIYVLFFFILSSFAGVPLLPLLSFFLIGAISFNAFFKSWKSARPSSTDTLIGWALFTIFAGIAWYWLPDIWVAPSQDDTLNHLGFLDAILHSHLALLGKINRPGSDWFGESAYHFYPTGSHALTALWIYPLSRLGFDWPKLFKAFQIVSLGLLPAFCWWASLRAFPRIARELRLFILVSAMTQMVFPLAAFGEGGSSRIFALTLFVPLWFRFFEKGVGFREGLAWSTVLAPTLLFIHPALLPLIALAILFSNRRAILGSVLGAPFGALIFYLILKSASQEVTAPGFLEALTGSLKHDAYGWFDRLKGPFHYWFSDPLGFGKFFSPKNYFIYLGIGLAVAGRIPRKVLLIFAVPFVMAALALIPNHAAQELGLIFYHSVKRISELTPLLGFTIACFAATWVSERYSLRKFAKWGAASVAASFLLLFVYQSPKEMNAVLALFNAPKDSVMLSWQEHLKSLESNDRVLIDQHGYDPIRYLIPQVGYTLLPECGEVGDPSPYCQVRRSFGQKLLNGSQADFSFKGRVWWLPSVENYGRAIEMAQERHLPQIAIDDHTSLIQVFANSVH